MEYTENLPVLDKRLPWHKPEVQRLQVGLDTQGGASQVAKFGSGDDVDHMTIIGD